MRATRLNSAGDAAVTARAAASRILTITRSGEAGSASPPQLFYLTSVRRPVETSGQGLLTLAAMELESGGCQFVKQPLGSSCGAFGSVMSSTASLQSARHHRPCLPFPRRIVSRKETQCDSVFVR